MYILYGVADRSTTLATRRVVIKGKELLSELAGWLVGSKQVFEPLELVENDEVRLEGVHADARQLIAKRPHELTPIGEIILGPVLPFPAKPLPETVELLPEPRLSPSAGRLVVARDRLPELLTSRFIQRRRGDILEVPAKVGVRLDRALEDASRTDAAHGRSSPCLGEQAMEKRALSGDPSCRLEVERGARRERDEVEAVFGER